MGTFTKSFGAVGGYIAADRHIIAKMRSMCPSSAYGSSISPPAVQQVISALRIIMGETCGDLGQRKLQALRDNSNWFRDQLLKRGCHLLGDWDSPIIPLMLYHPSKIQHFSRECLKRGLATVVVGFPATPIITSRSRICISAAHTRKQLEEALEKVDEVCTILSLKYNQMWFSF